MSPVPKSLWSIKKQYDRPGRPGDMGNKGKIYVVTETGATKCLFVNSCVFISNV